MEYAEQRRLLVEALRRCFGDRELSEMDVVALMKVFLNSRIEVPTGNGSVEVTFVAGREDAAEVLCEVWSLPSNVAFYRASYDAADFTWDSEAVTERIYEWATRLRSCGFVASFT